MNVQLPRVLTTIGSDSEVVLGSILVPEARKPTVFSMPAMFMFWNSITAQRKWAQGHIFSSLFEIGLMWNGGERTRSAGRKIEDEVVSPAKARPKTARFESKYH